MADADPQEITIPVSSRYGGQILELFIPWEKIQSKVTEIAASISDRFRTRCPILIGVLNGAFMFMADLVRQLDIDFEVDFIKIVSYGAETTSTGKVRLKRDISADITGRDVVIVEDIVDTGLSVEFLRSRMEEATPASVTFVTLLLKDEVANLDFPIDYVGFNIPNRFFVGYGLDIDQKMRGLRSLYALKEN